MRYSVSSIQPASTHFILAKECLTRILCLALSFILVGHAQASSEPIQQHLRQTGLEESEPSRRELAARLQSAALPNVFPGGVIPGTADSSAAIGMEERPNRRRWMKQVARIVGGAAVGGGLALPAATPRTLFGQGNPEEFLPRPTQGVPPARLPPGLMNAVAISLVDANRVNLERERLGEIEDVLVAIRVNPIYTVIALEKSEAYIHGAGQLSLPRRISLLNVDPTNEWIGDLVVNGGVAAGLTLRGRVVLTGKSHLLNSTVVGQVFLLGEGNRVEGNRIIPEASLEGAAIIVGNPGEASNDNRIQGNLVVVTAESGRRRSPAALHILTGNGNRIRDNTLINWAPNGAGLVLGPWKNPGRTVRPGGEATVERNVIASMNLLPSPDVLEFFDPVVIRQRETKVTGGNNLLIGATTSSIHQATDRRIPPSDTVFRKGEHSAGSAKNSQQPGDYRIEEEQLGSTPVGIFRQQREPAGQEEVRFFDGLTDAATGVPYPNLETGLEEGVIEPGTLRAVVNLQTANLPQGARLFVHEAFPGKDFTGLEEILLPADPGRAREVLRASGLEEGDVIVLPTTVAAGMEEGYRLAGVDAPVVVLDLDVFEEVSTQVLSGFARIAQNLKGLVVRIGLKQWLGRVMSGDNYLSLQL